MVSNVYRWGLTLFLRVNLIFDRSMTFSNWIADGAAADILPDFFPAAARWGVTDSWGAAPGTEVAGGAWAGRLTALHSRQRLILAARRILVAFLVESVCALRETTSQLGRSRCWRGFNSLVMQIKRLESNRPRQTAPLRMRLFLGYTDCERSSSVMACSASSGDDSAAEDLFPRRMATIPVRTISRTP